jgi:hypothetical protein
MKNIKLSKNFMLSEFGYVEPDPRLLHLIQLLRDTVGVSVVITSGPRTVVDHIRIYRDLVAQKALQVPQGKTVYDIIPWQSKHLPRHGTPYLEAVDITVEGMTGLSLEKNVRAVRESLQFKSVFPNPCFLGVGVGKNYLHIDVGREVDARWTYGY